MSEPLLPPLREDGNDQVAVFANHGVWDRRGTVALAQVARSLRLDQADDGEAEIASIPSMWARPLLFEMALFDHDHLLHDTVVREWRGLLALLALRHTKGIYDVEAVEVIVPANDELDAVNALYATRPTHETVASDTVWAELYVIKRSGQVVGMTSPNTLVCTAQQYEARLEGYEVDWCKGDVCRGLNVLERRQLLTWLDTVRADLLQDNNVRPNANRWNDLLKAFEEYIDAVESPDERSVRVGIDPTVGWQIGVLGMQRGLYRHLDRSVAPAAEDPTRSHVRLKPSEARRQNGAVPLLVIAEDLHQQWNIARGEIEVIGGASLAASAGPYVVNPKEYGGRQLGSCEVIGAQQFLAETITVVKDRGALPGMARSYGADMLLANNDEVTPLLPINERLLQYLTAVDIAARVSFTPVNNGILLTLRLPLSGMDGNGRDCLVKKTYRWADQEILLVDDLPVMEIWPNFTTTDRRWQRYYTFYRRSGTKLYAKPYGADTPLARHVEYEDDRPDTVDVEILMQSDFPEALICEVEESDETGHAMVFRDAGLLLLPEPRLSPPTGQIMNIGIDFGTSGTNAYTQQAEARPEPLAIPNLLHQVTDSGMARGSLYGYFMSPAEEKLPILSLFLEQLHTGGLPNLIRPVIDGHMVYQPNLSAVKRGADASSRVATNLKWGGMAERQRARAFLAELSLQCAALAASRGVASVSWRFAYPTQFSEAERVAFDNIWRAICDETESVTGVNTEDERPRQLTESVASARFLANHPNLRQAAPFGRGVVCVDIGGGTSDLSVWQGGRDGLKFQTSLRYAGRDIFCKQLVNQPGVLAAFSLRDWDAIGESSEPTAEWAGLENLLREQTESGRTKGEEMLLSLPTHETNPDVAVFLQSLAAGVTGLMYYVGLILRSLAASGDYTRVLPDVYVLGNGAKILNWLAAGRFAEGCAAEKLLKATIREASGFDADDTFRVLISPLPKSEVAYGLVSDQFDFQFHLDDTSPVAGEDFQVSGEGMAWSSRVTPSHLAEGLTIGELEQFKCFLDQFQANCPDAGLREFIRDQVAVDQTKNQLDVILANQQGREPDQLSVNPPFIMALRHYLQIHRWSTGDEQLNN